MATGKDLKEIKRGRARTWLMRALAVSMSLLALELGFRGFLFATGSTYSAQAAEKSMRRILTGMRQELPGSEDVQVDDQGLGRMLHPFIGFETLRGQRALDRQFTRFLNHGLRRDEAQIWVVGGSVAAIFASPQNGGRRLVERLTEAGVFGDRKPIINSFARASFKQPQQLGFVGYLLSLGLRPDVLINLDGFNEAAIGYRNATIASSPLYPSITQWGNLAVGRATDPALADLKFEMTLAGRKAQRTADRTLSCGLHNSALIGWVTLRRLESLRRRRGALQSAIADALANRRDDPSLRGAQTKDLVKRAPEIIYRNWVESSRSLNALAKSRSFFYLHVLQPTLHDGGSKPLTAKELEGGAGVSPMWIEGVHRCYPQFKNAADELAGYGVEFFDGSMVFSETTEELYYDACHFNETGNLILADRIADELIERLSQ